MNPINLSKEQTLKQINLRKDVLQQIILTKPELRSTKSRVFLTLDASGSMENLYKNGTVQKVLENILPIAMEFDDNGMLEVILFSNDPIYIGEVNVDNIHNFVEKNILHKCPFSGTEYAPPLKTLSNIYLKDNIDKNRTLKDDIKTKDVVDHWKVKEPIYNIFITDGENSDERETKEIMNKMSHLPIFNQFVGIGNSSFSFLSELDNMGGRFIDNANFFKYPFEELESLTVSINSKKITRKPKESLKINGKPKESLFAKITSWFIFKPTESSETTESSDNQNSNDNQASKKLYNLLLSEYPSWIIEARKNNLIF